MGYASYLRQINNLRGAADQRAFIKQLKTPYNMRIQVTYFETNETELVTLNKAYQRLSGYWDKSEIKPMLKQGLSLWTPYAEYKAI